MQGGTGGGEGACGSEVRNRRPTEEGLAWAGEGLGSKGRCWRGGTGSGGYQRRDGY